jgi:hypothetical protein
LCPVRWTKAGFRVTDAVTSFPRLVEEALGVGVILAAHVQPVVQSRGHLDLGQDVTAVSSVTYEVRCFGISGHV